MHLEPLLFPIRLGVFLDLVSRDVVKLANLIECVLHDSLEPFAVLLFAQERKAIVQISDEVESDRQLLVRDFAVFQKHRFV